MIARIAALVAVLLIVGCVRIEAYRVAGGIGKVTQEYDGLSTGPADGKATAGIPVKPEANGSVATAGSTGVINVNTGADVTMAAEKQATTSVDAKPGVNATNNGTVAVKPTP